ncbi:MAG TPA: T9SS type A sorting domain-containing protein, partial [Bacteroidia bacterium]|nr:T9SS type A sorting domain-containing protein [Bacteroidia bacterium]
LEEKTGPALAAPKSQDASGYAAYWFNMRKDENGVINYARMADVAEQVARESRRHTPSAWPLTFTELGPDNVGGRTRAICIDHADHLHIFAGGVSGGLFESHDGGSSWQHASVSDQYDVLTITSICQAADNSWYFGTGEGIFYGYYGDGTGGFLGGGIWKSSDNGVTWARLSSTTPVNPTNSGNTWASIGRLAADPTNASRIYAATGNGFKISSDGGVTWVSGGTSLTGLGYDVKVASDGSVYTVNGTRLFKSPNGNPGSFVSMAASTGYPQSGFRRTEIAIAPSNPNCVYAYFGASGQGTFGAYLTTDGGNTWTQIASTGNLVFEPLTQSDYAIGMGVDPFDPFRLVVGGLDLWKWEITNGNPAAPVGQWTRISEWQTSTSDPTYVHADQHIVCWDPAQQGKFFVGCDGGIHMTLNKGLAFIPANKKYQVTQFYDVDCDYLAPSRNVVFGGCQDNGTQFIDGKGNTTMAANQIGGGDGGQVAMSFLNPNAMFGTIYYGTCERSANRGSGPNSFYNGRISVQNGGPGKAGYGNFVTPVRLWESSNDPNSQDSLVFAATRQSASLAPGTGTTTTWTFTLTSEFNGITQPSASILPGSMALTCGSISLTDDGAGNIVGSGITASGNTINYATRTLKLSFSTAPATSDLIKVAYDVTYPAGSSITVSSKTNNLHFTTVTPSSAPITSLGPNDTIYVKDIIQAKFAVGFSYLNGLFVTNKPLDFSTTPQWFKVAGALGKPDAFNSGQVQDMKWSANGNTLFFTSDAGGIFRVDGLSFLRDSINSDIETKVGSSIVANPRTPVTCTQIGYTGGSIGNGGFIGTQVDVDPSNPNNLIVAVAGYMSGTHVYLCTNATTAPSQKNNMSNFTGVQGNLIAMPVYACSFDKYNTGHVLLGTEFGVYSTDNIMAGSVTWTTQCALGSFPRVPTLKIHQSRFEPWNGCQNAGVFYFATHGRGTWKSEVSYVPMGVKPIAGPDASAVGPIIHVFPNPMTTSGNVSFNLNKSGDVHLSIYSLRGQLVKTLVYAHQLEGQNTVEFDSTELPAGTYLLSFESGQQKGVSRFVVTK